MLAGAGRYEFVRWAGQACRFIRFRPDRERVQDELVAHMEDARDAFEAAGESQDRAIGRALEQMGDADTVARQLQRVYRPFWGYLWKYTRVLAGIAVVIIAFHVVSVCFACLDGDSYGEAEMTAYVRPQNLEAHVISDFTPQGSVKVSGYEISVARICFKEYPDGYREAYFVLKVRHWNPWQKTPMFHQNLYAVDDCGNLYPPRYYGGAIEPENREVCGNIGAGSAFVSYYELWIANVDPEASSFTLGFDDYGVQWALDFPVEGGIEYAAQ